MTKEKEANSLNAATTSTTTSSTTTKKAAEEVIVSEADSQLKNELESLVGVVCGGGGNSTFIPAATSIPSATSNLPQPTSVDAALDQMLKLIQQGTATLTSVPKPLKFLHAHYPALTVAFDSFPPGSPLKVKLSDVLSVLAMLQSFTPSPSQESLPLKYRLSGSILTKDSIGSFGFEYVQQLSSHLIASYDPQLDSHVSLAKLMIAYFMQSSAETNACDLALETSLLSSHLLPLVSSVNCDRVVGYVKACAAYLPFPDNNAAYGFVFDCCVGMQRWCDALRVGIRVGDEDMIGKVFTLCPDPYIKKQMGFTLARLLIPLPTSVQADNDELKDIVGNSHLSKHFRWMAKELDVMAVKVPEDVYKSHLEKNHVGVTIDSAKQNLAATFVNAFLNCGYGCDTLIIGDKQAASAGEGGVKEESAGAAANVSASTSNWIYKNKEHGMTSAAASIGVLMLWDVEMGLSEVDRFLYSDQDFIKAGAYLGIGIVNATVRNESDPAMALLSEHVEHENSSIRAAAIMGLGMAYSGTRRQDVADLLLPSVSDIALSIELSSLAALSISLIFVGSSNGDISSTILQTLMERDAQSLQDPFSKFLAVALGLLFLGRQEDGDTVLETLKVIEGQVAREAEIWVKTCAYAGTGNVLKVQEMMHACTGQPASVEGVPAGPVGAEGGDMFQAFATLGVALIAAGEEVGTQMAMRSFNHLMHYGEPNVRRAVPLALALLCPSNPLPTLLDTLSKYSHDNDKVVASNAIVALGIVGAGTNNSRMAGMLRQLASYYHKEPNVLFCVRVAQGLLHMGKGTMTLNPFCIDRELCSFPAMAGLLVTLVAFFEPDHFVLGKHHYFLYYLVGAVYPRFLITVDENLEPVHVSVRVGSAVDTVGLAGKPKGITGFQTHDTPVLLGVGERAELVEASGEEGAWETVEKGVVLEGLVILKKKQGKKMDLEKK